MSKPKKNTVLHITIPGDVKIDGSSKYELASLVAGEFGVESSKVKITAEKLSKDPKEAAAEHLGRLLKKGVLVKTGAQDYPYAEVTSVVVEDFLFNGDDIQVDTGDEPGENQRKGRAVAIRTTQS